MKVNRKLLPIKAHFFLFMCAMGPILPQLSVFGKQMGVSSIVMGTITGILPFAFLLAKPAFGMLVDVYRDYRKFIFISLIVGMTASYGSMIFIPTKQLATLNAELKEVTFETCNETEFDVCEGNGVYLSCKINGSSVSFYSPDIDNLRLCGSQNLTGSLTCLEDLDKSTECLYKSTNFWFFVLAMSLGTIGFNVVNSISDAICFDVIGDEFDYGKQRVWGTIGFGLTALISGYAVDFFSIKTISYTPALIVMTVFSILDMIACLKLKLPVIDGPENIFKDLKNLLNNRHVIVFMFFAVCAGIVDSFIIYFLFWYLEDLASSSGSTNIKLLEGLIVAAETLGGEVVFFSISGKILERFGHVHSFSMCFLNYALRLGLISIVPSPWWLLPIEFFLQGPTYALTYTCIVAYANELAPQGATATMQGIAAGMDDGVGYAIGSLIGGFLYKYLGGVHAMQAFSAFALFCSISHLLIHKTILKKTETSLDVIYRSPEEAIKTVEVS